MPPFYFLTFAKVSVSVSKKFGLKKVSVSVSKTFGLEKKSRYRSRKHLVSKKSLGIGLENIWSRKKVSVSVSKILVSKKSLGIGLDEIFWSRHSVHWYYVIVKDTSHLSIINTLEAPASISWHILKYFIHSHTICFANTNICDCFHADIYVHKIKRGKSMPSDINISLFCLSSFHINSSAGDFRNANF